MEASAAKIKPSAGMLSLSSFIITWLFMTGHIPGDKTRCAFRDKDSVCVCRYLVKRKIS